MTLPLSGVRVIELANNVAGPYGTWILAQLGAEVVKIERPGGGDDARGWGPPFWRGTSTVFQVLNREKLSIIVDLKDEGERARLRGLIVDTADVVLQSLRPGVATELGLDSATLCALSPRLIYANLHAFGATGPMARRPGYDALMQAFGGVMSVTGETDGPPVRAGVSVVDKGTGMWCAIGVLSALYRRRETGRGGVVDASLFETALAWTAFYTADYQATGEVPIRRGSGARGIVPYEAFRCADGDLIVAAPNDRLFAKLAALLGHPEWSADPRFADSPSRSVNREALKPMIDAVLSQHPRAHWREVLDRAGIPNAPIQTMDEVVADEQVDTLGILQPTGEGDMRLCGLPLSFDGERPPLRRLAPEPGQDTDAVFGRSEAAE